MLAQAAKSFLGEGCLFRSVEELEAPAVRDELGQALLLGTNAGGKDLLGLAVEKARRISEAEDAGDESCPRRGKKEQDFDWPETGATGRLESTAFFEGKGSGPLDRRWLRELSVFPRPKRKR
ncbi:hypothetical protein [Verrucomicrobium sp. 3C]|uniref:hypothetical protein n=1 Tax=Verrucomicrobium sp. 3C TaxID=1134055 RepID=UPI0004782AE4|nr:hypothetical protein [Verrucomicrobium sp. 3C]